MYWITDNYGTEQFAWNWNDAIDWLLHCSNESARIESFWTRKIIAHRAAFKAY